MRGTGRGRNQARAAKNWRSRSKPWTPPSKRSRPEAIAPCFVCLWRFVKSFDPCSRNHFLSECLRQRRQTACGLTHQHVARLGHIDRGFKTDRSGQVNRHSSFGLPGGVLAVQQLFGHRSPQKPCRHSKSRKAVSEGVRFLAAVVCLLDAAEAYQRAAEQAVAGDEMLRRRVDFRPGRKPRIWTESKPFRAATKSEIQNPKSETSSKPKIQMSQTTLRKTRRRVRIAVLVSNI